MEVEMKTAKNPCDTSYTITSLRFEARHPGHYMRSHGISTGLVQQNEAHKLSCPTPNRKLWIVTLEGGPSFYLPPVNTLFAPFIKSVPCLEA